MHFTYNFKRFSKLHISLVILNSLRKWYTYLKRCRYLFLFIPFFVIGSPSIGTLIFLGSWSFLVRKSFAYFGEEPFFSSESS